MTTISSTITFARSGTSVDLNSPAPGYHVQAERSQVQGQTAAGDRYVYDKATTTRILEIPLRLTGTQKANLEDFWENTCTVGVDIFDYTDHYGTTHHNCRFVNTSLRWRKTQDGRYETQLRIEIQETQK